MVERGNGWYGFLCDVAQFDVTTHDDTGTQSVPVAWFDPPPTVAGLEAGAELVVIGSVRRRFFHAGGTTQSRTEVVAEKVVPVMDGDDRRELADLLALVAVSGACDPTTIRELAR